MLNNNYRKDDREELEYLDDTDRKDNQEELKDLVLKGCCPYCSSKNVHYREFLTNLEFGFDCFSCNWKGRYIVREFLKFSQN